MENILSFIKHIHIYNVVTLALLFHFCSQTKAVTVSEIQFGSLLVNIQCYHGHQRYVRQQTPGGSHLLNVRVLSLCRAYPITTKCHAASGQVLAYPLLSSSPVPWHLPTTLLPEKSSITQIWNGLPQLIFLFHYIFSWLSKLISSLPYETFHQVLWCFYNIVSLSRHHQSHDTKILDLPCLYLKANCKPVETTGHII